VTSFLARRREAAKTIGAAERQCISRLLVKEILVADDAIVIRRSIPRLPVYLPTAAGKSVPGGNHQPVGDPVLRTESHGPALAERSKVSARTVCNNASTFSVVLL
jgi:hypothetical protein